MIKIDELYSLVPSDQNGPVYRVEHNCQIPNCKVYVYPHYGISAYDNINFTCATSIPHETLIKILFIANSLHPE